MQSKMSHFLVFCFCLSAATSSLALTAVPSGSLLTPLFGISAVYDGDDFVYLMGGSSRSGASNSIYRYKIVQEEVTKHGILQYGTSHAATVVSTMDGRVYYFGGRSEQTFFDTILAWDPDTPDVPATTVVSLPNTLAHHIAVGNDEDVYIAGGWDNVPSQGQRQKAIFHMNTTNLEFTYAGNLPEGRTHHSAVWYNGKMVIFGGSTSSGAKNDIIQWDPTSNKTELWDSVLSIPITSSSAVLVGNTAYVISGMPKNPGWPFNLSKVNLDTREVFYEKIVNFPVELQGTSAVYVPKNNQIIVFGGASLHGSPTTYIFKITL